ncbi:MAG: hypothetical protein MUF23_09270 [Pirellula sp.]|nr:hypothetical protein [Pirellula sp.]
MFRSMKFLARSVAALVLVSGSTVFANNVQVSLEGSLLKVFGDNVANGVLIEQTSAGVRVTGRAGTRINGRPSVLFAGIALNAMEIRMEGGNDAVTLSGLQIANDLYVNLGSGNDRLDTRNPNEIIANFAIEGAEGNDTVILSSGSVGEDLYIDGGIGALTANVANMDLGKGLTIIGDAAADSVTVSNTMAAEFISIETKEGNDVVSVSRGMSFVLFVNSDAGADRVTVREWMTLEDAGVFTGVGNDQVTLATLSIGKSLTVSVDEGGDTVLGTRVTVEEDAVFEGGAGVDTITDRGITGGIKKDIKEFERILR